jgi:spermidine synthase
MDVAHSARHIRAMPEEQLIEAGPAVGAASPTAVPATTALPPGLPRIRAGLLLLTFAAAIFLNAALLFAVQPMFTKMVLPLLGGSPAVWNTCLLFFQTALLGGYLYAHLTSRWWSPRVQAAVHLGLLAVSLAVLPIRIPEAWSTPPAGALPIPWLLALLAISLGLPFFLLSAGAPMLQRWFASTRHPSARNPYFLYAASNLGSFVALLAYPFLIEPRLRVSEQSVTWLEVYYVLLALVAACAAGAYFLSRRAEDEAVAPEIATPPVADASTTVDSSGTPPAAHLDPTAPVAPVAPLASDGAVPVRRPGALRGTMRRLVEENPDAVDALLERPEWSPEAPSIVPNAQWRLRWVLLSFAPASLLIGVTTFLSTDIASMPFLWVVPLALYLLTFVLVFARRPLFPRRLMLHVQLVLALVLVVLLCLGSGVRLVPQAFWHLLAFFATAMVCHRELADSRPRAEYLTEFYLWMSFGGVLGGAFNVIVAPLVYNTLIEYPFALIIALGLRPSPLRHYGGRRELALDIALPALLMVAVWGGFRLPKPPDQWFSHGVALWLALAAGVALLFWRRPLRLALGAGAIIAAVKLNAAMESDVLLERRSFFGIYRVRRILEYHLLQHGTTTHGGQSRQSSRRLEPLTYYHREGPMGDLFETVATERPFRRVALVGLGAGTTACYGREGERWTFYEIDPLVARIARTPSLFTYLRDCPPEIEVELGDARLSLARAPDNEFDIIVLDAFSSDAIPAHLITREALRMYLAKLRDGGAIAFHISNRYLDLRPVLIALANDARIPGAVGDQVASDEDRVRLYYSSRWVVLARRPSTLAGLVRREGWSPLASEPATRVWTDDFSDILSVMKWR